MKANSQFELKNLNEKSAKALASSATKFLSSKGIKLPHTTALDMAGILCGYADWQGLRAAIDASEKQHASSPIKMSYEDFIATFKPVKNWLYDNATADGYAFDTSGPQLEAVQAAQERCPGTVWSCVEAEGTMIITEGFHRVNLMFYIITNRPANPGQFYEIPYGHDLDDLKFEVSVVDLVSEEVVFTETRYGSDIEEIQMWAKDMCQDEVSEINQAGGNAAIMIAQVM